ncbi:hypothetical protein GCM10009083_01220 [Halopseudomonas pertucinogena]|uniref:Uncharacterized protein n=1 Tax=Halopseudomonas pertucinogena TaxID=86175 RepID=A0ABQ2CJE2_9GAMM|nr:hypothetical protein GCM10009083_01220 [Halopseudomonas pertucinogena]
MFFKIEQGVGIVNQDVGIKNVEGVSGRSARFHGLYLAMAICTTAAGADLRLAVCGADSHCLTVSKDH